MRISTVTQLIIVMGALATRAAEPSASLKDAFRGDFLIGAAVSPRQFHEGNAGEAALVKAQFDSISPENVLKWASVHPKPGQYNFEPADQYVAFGEKNHMFIVGHALVWDHQTPDWVFRDDKGNFVDRDTLLGRMREHIQTVVGRYKGRIQSWDVVNEALAEDGTLRETPWMKIIGPDYIEKAFQYAHEADPDAQLNYNDYSLENEPKRNGAVELIKKLKGEGIPVAVVGMQDHVKLDWPSPEDEDATIGALAAAGVKVAITELDVDVLPAATRQRGADVGLSVQARAELNPYVNALPDATQQALAKRYADLFACFIRHRDAVTRVTFWGVTDAGSWLNNWPVHGRTAYPLLFDRDGHPKPAFDAVVRLTMFTPPAHMTAEQDHQHMMDRLGIQSLRPGADPNHPNAPNAVNYDEAKVKHYTLPDPLMLKNGNRVRTPEIWGKQRRPEIVEDFDREVYGRVPPDVPPVHWEVTGTQNEVNGDVPIVTKHLVGHVDNSSYPLINVDVQLTLTTPAAAKGPVPVILEFGFDPSFMRRFREMLAKRGVKLPPPGPGEIGGPGPSWQQQLLAKGWGYAILVPTSVQADDGSGLTGGIIGLVNKGQPRKPDDWGALRAWAWGASRALDYFATDQSVDAKHVGIEGLSRYGKATLVTMAYDQRFAIAFVGSSGEGGAKLSRRNFGELVENLAGGESHWMAGNFMKYGGPLTANDLPVDAHELIALCAPRPVFISTGSPSVEGKWVDQRGMFLAEVAAGPVYRLLGKKDLGTTEMPAMETTLIDGDLAFREHSGGHTTGPNWPAFLTFAQRYLGVSRR